MSIARPADHAGFFAQLPLLESEHDTFDLNRYRPAPDDWALVVTDVVDSTGAIERGLHKTVNFVAAMGIAGLRNLCAPIRIPFLFGGDGAVVLVPPEKVAQARIELARARGQAAREFRLKLRVGLVAVGALRRFGCDVRVGRFEPTPGNSFGVFLGGGIGQLEAALRGKGDPELARLATIPESLDDGEAVDLEGLSCRWDTLRSTRGTMLTLILRGRGELGDVYAEIMRLAGPEMESRPVSLDTLRARWPPNGFMLEARARRRGGSLLAWTARVLAETLVARLVLARGKPIGGFDPERYRAEIITNTDFCKHDDTLCFVIDCALGGVEEIKSYLDRMAATRGLRYGIHLSDTALMTCLVTAPADSLHVHFLDGGGGGYTSASKKLKAS
ncbi:DUF3095 domain-containing protein [Variovorax saccharolyticus]|uniref:DUF3095 domain-containing protein n=1 Tax=Variovorax saccharolyticus TaxID=3053516 RepID=UPI002578A509|nr:DUF3095 domain-containing protein [Variovorax sp. J31P216]MDM0024466.1 DUF3095 domain-containing protein [Variovorax sp. J31P216]